MKTSSHPAPQAGAVATALRAALGTLDGEAVQDGAPPVLVLVGAFPEAVIPPAAAGHQGDAEDGEGAFLAYGRSWFC